MDTPFYEIIDHTADIGIRVFGRTRKELFQNAALAFFDIVGKWGKVDMSLVETIRLEGTDDADLFQRWLDELNFLFQTRELVFHEFDVRFPSDLVLEAEARGRKLDLDIDDVSLDIKAVTHHELKVEQKPTGWHASVIFDI